MADLDDNCIEELLEDRDEGWMNDSAWFSFPENDNPFSDCTLDNKELQQFQTLPDVEKWKDLLPQDNATHITFDDSKRKQWKLARAEINHCKKRWGELLNPESNVGSAIDGVSNEDIVSYCLGANSKVGTYLQEQLCISSDCYLRFIHTFCLQAAHSITCTQLYDEKSLLKEHTLMRREEYTKVWDTISTKRKLKKGIMSTSRRTSPLWEGMEQIINQLCRFVSIDNREGRISIALDDDKIWLNTRKSATVDLFKLKFCAHVRANRKGIVAHTAVSTGAMVPLGISFEKTNDSSGTCFKRLLNFLFDYGGGVNLRNVTVHSDRGYLVPAIVFDYLLSCGAEVLGTTKRLAKCWPFTYNQQLPESDKRTLLDTKGAPTLFLKYYGDGDKKLFASAFRNGTSKIATAISSIHDHHEWEGIVLDPSELRAYEQDKNSLLENFFQRVDIDIESGDQAETEDEKAELDYILNQVIEPVTLRQGTADWHYLRKFSLTSSQSHSAFEKAIFDFKEDSNWVAVAEYLYGETEWRDKLKIITPAIEEASGGNEEFTEEPEVESLTGYVKRRCQQHADEGTIESIESQAFSLLNYYSNETTENPDGNFELNEQGAKEKLKTQPKDVKRSALQILTSRISNPEHRKNANNGDLVQWLMKTNAEREFLFYKASGLKTLLKEKGMKFAPCSGAVTIDRLIGALSGKNLDGVIVPTNQDDDDEGESNTEELNLDPKAAATRSILQKSFLPHQKGKLREHCTLGHQLEVPIVKKFIKEFNDDPSKDHRVMGAYTAGLAAMKNRPYAKDSIDFILTLRDESNDEIKAWGFECKGRVTSKTAANEEENTREIHIRINDDEVHKEVKAISERFQVLQHATVYKLDTVVLAIADNQGDLIRSIIIDFSQELRQSFTKVLVDIKNSCLSWAYPEHLSPSGGMTIPPEISAIANTIRSINGEHALQGTFNLWIGLQRLPKPFPSLLRLIPAICAYWNTAKGGSDTCTFLMDSQYTQIPKSSINTETTATGRLLELVLVLIHRSFQIMSSDDDLTTYDSLAKYRNAANKRYSFYQSLLESAAVLKREVNIVTTAVPEVTRQSEHRQRPIRCRLNGLKQNRLDFDPGYVQGTPKRRKKKGVTAEPIEKCTGFPVYQYQANAHRCSYCKTGKTHWFCIGCKQWLCMTKRNLKDKNENPESLELFCRTTSDSKEVKYQKICYHHAHEAAWCRLNRERNELDSPNQD